MRSRRQTVLLARLREVLAGKDPKRGRRQLLRRHPGEIADAFPLLEQEERAQLFALVSSLPQPYGILERAEPDVLAEQVIRLGLEKGVSLLRRLPVDLATAVVRDLPTDLSKAITERLTAQHHRVADLLTYDEDTAAGRMDKAPATASSTLSVGAALAKLSQVHDDLANAIYVVDNEGRLTGVASWHTLVAADQGEPLSSVAVDDPVTVGLGDPKEEVVRAFDRYHLLSVPVVDEEGILAGILTVEDVMDLVQEEATEDAFLMAGLDEEELSLTLPTLTIATRRVGWLLITLLGGLITGALLNTRGTPLPETTLLFAFLPVVMALGGAIGNQSAVIVVRALATGRLDNEKPWGFLLKQFRVGLVMAALCGGVVLVVSRWAGILPSGPTAPMIVGASLLGVILAGSMVGAGIPLLLSRKNIDPAIASSPLIGSICDLCGVSIYTGFIALWI
ncbi:magnesium transporter [bacterium]|nr:magnesium transporter [bacterium]